MPLTITSNAFVHEREIPSRYTCEGDDIAPPLAWNGAPEGTQSLALVVKDPDAPDPAAPRMTWTHWVVFNLPPDTIGLPERCQTSDLPVGACEGKNDWGRTGYGGPCPPIGRHRYLHTLYALDCRLEGLGTPTRQELESAIEGHVLESATLIGTYQKQGGR